MTHTPVLLAKSLALVDPQPGNRVLDCTLGLTGHATEFLKRVGDSGKLVGLDTDERNLRLAKENLSQKNVEFVHANFRQIGELFEPESFDVIFFDLGVSSPHFDDADRGFSFQSDGPLDMRLDADQPLTAAAIVNGWSEHELAEIFFEFGEIRTAKKIARQIATARKIEKIRTTSQLAEIVESKTLLPQVFQALRIATNDELAALALALAAAVRLLKKGGRLGVISFHSLEDRIVKKFFREKSRDCICPPEALECCCNHSPALSLVTRKATRPSDEEIAANPRSRSARLRVAKKN